MGGVFITPSWFFIYSIILEVFFAVITFIVSYYSFKIHKLTDERDPKLFSTAFFFIGISYLLQSTLNFIILSKLDNNVSVLIRLRDAALLNVLGIYAHALFFIIGIIIITYMTLKIKNARILTLLLSTIIISVFFSTNKLFMFYVLSSVLLIHIVMYYFIHYMTNKKKNALIVLMSMIFLLLSSFHFIFAVDHAIYYVLGHILEFISYLLILINLILILKHDKKKR